MITNSTAVAEVLEKHQCDGAHRHVWLEGGRAKACEKYPDQFCKIVFEAFRSESGCDEKARMSDEC